VCASLAKISLKLRLGNINKFRPAHTTPGRPAERARSALSVPVFFLTTPCVGPPRHTHTQNQGTREVGGRGSPGPADAVGVSRFTSFLLDDAPSPSQAD
jgi:hypothetical protein